MATEIEKPLPIFKLQVGELNIQLIGGLPQGTAKVAYMASDGTTVGETSFSAWSPETWEKIMDICKSIEMDLEKALGGPNFIQWDHSDEHQNIEYRSEEGNWK